MVLEVRIAVVLGEVGSEEEQGDFWDTEFVIWVLITVVQFLKFNLHTYKLYTFQ